MNYDFILNKNKYAFSYNNVIEVVSEKLREGRGKEITLFIRELKLYGVVLKDLTSLLPSLKEKNQLLNIAININNSPVLSKEFFSIRRININKLAKIAGYSKRYLEKWSSYIIAYTIIAGNEAYKGLQDYLSIAEANETVLDTKALTIAGEIRGLVLSESKGSSIILTSYGEFINIKPTDKTPIGAIAVGTKKKTLSDYKGLIALIILALTVAAISFTIYYSIPKSTIVIEHNSKYTITVNKLNRIIETTAPNQKLRGIISSVHLKNKSIDKGLISFFEVLEKNELLSSDKEMTIIISGEELEYGTLNESRNYLKEKKIPTSINNAGKEYKNK
ncbi:anti-sigma-I factor RsgI family protein [Alloiococcus sp. CFN-8]|uniref:anti-sigma-I factor RsgI family protein n=1 Tax=Alloiococcus sp. CFN-8 TaxID=3416081 RepID=UPI003CF7450B